jgi:hypothetical protein
VIRYPGAPADGYLRLAISSEHTPAQLAALLAVFERDPGFLNTSTPA